MQMLIPKKQYVLLNLLLSLITPLSEVLPWRYRISTHIVLPKIKFLSKVGIRVNGIQKTANSKSDMDRFSRNTFVTVRIRRFCASVTITKVFPITDSRNIKLYNGIRTSPLRLGGLPRGGLMGGTVVFVKLDPSEAVKVIAVKSANVTEGKSMSSRSLCIPVYVNPVWTLSR